MATELITSSRTINASPETVWATVSDLTTMGERSPQCRKMIVLGGAPSVGTRTVNVNKRGLLYWPTTAKVTRWEPNEVLEWHVPVNGSHWRYELADNGDGTTTLTESRTIASRPPAFARGFVAVLLGGNETFESEVRQGMAQTLAAIADAAERAG